MNYDTIYHILLKIDNIPDLKNFCEVSSLHYQVCKENKNKIWKNLIEHYQIKYDDPSNFIYKYNGKKMENYKDDNGKWLYKDLFKLYMKHYYKTEIICPYKKITSIPSYPNLKELYCASNQLTSIPSYPNLKELDCTDNQLSSIPSYPNLKKLDCNRNNLTSISSCPNLEYLYCNRNQLTSLPDNYTRLIDLYCNRNRLTSLPDNYPQLEELVCADNQLTSLPSYPALYRLECTGNQLTSLPKYPKIKYCYADNNLCNTN